MINASLVFGFDSDSHKVFPETLEWLVKHKIETITVHILTPYPGTNLFQNLLDKNRILDYNWEQYNTANVVFSPKNITKEELLKGYLWIYKEFYSFKNIWNRLPVYKKQRVPYLLFNFGYRKFGKFTSLLGKIGLMNQIGKLARKLSYNID